MKIKKNKKNFDSVLFFRKIKEQIAKEFEGKTFEEKREIIDGMKSEKLATKVSDTSTGKKYKTQS